MPPGSERRRSAQHCRQSSRAHPAPAVPTTCRPCRPISTAPQAGIERDRDRYRPLHAWQEQNMNHPLRAFDHGNLQCRLRRASQAPSSAQCVPVASKSRAPHSQTPAARAAHRPSSRGPHRREGPHRLFRSRCGTVGIDGSAISMRATCASNRWGCGCDRDLLGSGRSAQTGSSARRVSSQSLRAALIGSMPASCHQAASLPTRCTADDGCGRAGPRTRR